MFGAQVGPDDAVSNLSKWAAKFLGWEVPAWLRAPLADIWVTALGGALVAVGVIGLLIRRKRQDRRAPIAPIPDQDRDDRSPRHSPERDGHLRVRDVNAAGGSGAEGDGGDIEFRGRTVELGPGNYTGGAGGPGGKGGDVRAIAGEGNASPRPDLPLADLVEQWLEGTGDDGKRDGHFAATGKLFAQIRQEAVLGGVKTWGRRNCPMGQTRVPLTEIPKRHWEVHQLNLEDFLCDPEHRLGTTTRADHIADSEFYTDIQLNRREATAFWLPPNEPKQ